MIDTENLHVSDYIAILKRRRQQIISTAIIVFILGIILALTLPSEYRAKGIILIEQQQIPSDLVRSTVTGYVSQRIQIITQRLLTRENLVNIINKLNIYSEKKDKGKYDKIIARIRSNVKIKTVSASVTDSSGASRMVTSSFQLSFDAETPVLAHKVAKELVALFLNENVRIRTQKAETTSSFLQSEEEKIRLNVERLERQLAEFKEKNVGGLPELMGLNMQMMERSERDMEEARRQIYSLEERKMYLESQLAQLEPYTGQSPAARLKKLQTDYLTATSLYSADHPDVVRMRREIRALKREAGIIDKREIVAAQIKKTEIDLQNAQQQYSQDHPDVIKLRNTLVSLQKKLKKVRRSSVTTADIKPDNPAYVSIRSQLDSVTLNLRAAREKLERERTKLATYEGRLIQTPRVEQEGAALKREYANAVKKYDEIKQNLMNAELAVELEKGQKGGRYSLLEAPILPEKPVRPNRKAIVILGIVLGLMLGIAYASIAEYMDRSIRGSRAVADIFGEPPLASIPNFQFNA